MKSVNINRAKVEGIFSELEKPVKLLLFIRESECLHCSEAREILAELADITHKVTLETYNFAINKEKAAEFNIQRVPAIVPISNKDYGIRYYGLPTRLEFEYFLKNIVDISRGRTEMSDAHRGSVQAFASPLHVQLFVHGESGFGSDTMCNLARMAVESERLSVDFIDPLAFPELVKKYHIKGVPFAVVDEKMNFYAAMSKDELLDQLEKASR